VTAPLGAIRPIWFPFSSVNQIEPSGPVVIPPGLPGAANSSIAMAGDESERSTTPLTRNPSGVRMPDRPDAARKAPAAMPRTLEKLTPAKPNPP
jgi:hypothetical protein